MHLDRFLEQLTHYRQILIFQPNLDLEWDGIMHLPVNAKLRKVLQTWIIVHPQQRFIHITD